MLAYKISWIFLVISQLVFTIGIFIFSGRNIARLKVGVLALFACLWTIGHGILTNASDYFTVLFWAKEIFACATTIILIGYLLSKQFYNDDKKIKTFVIWAVFIFDICALLFTETVLKNFNPKGSGLVEKAPIGPFFGIIPSSYAFYIFLTISNYIKAFNRSATIVKRQILYVAYSTLFTIVFAFISAVFLPALNINSFVWLAPYGSVIYVAGITYAIFKYRLLDLNIIIKRTTLYLILIGLVTMVYAFTLMIMNQITGFNKISSTASMAITAFIIAFSIQPFKNWFDSLTDHVFFQKKYDPSQILGKVSRELSEAIQFQKAFQIVIEPLLYEVHVKSVAVYLREAGGDSYYSLHSKNGDVAEGLPEEIEEESPVVSYLAETSEILETAEFHHRFGNLYAEGKIVDQRKKDIYEMLQNKLGAGLVVPLILKKHIVGLMIIGSKLSGDLFSLQDISMLETLSNHLVTTIENIRMFEQMLNNERLRIIGTMSASVAHEIRNPLASIKTFVQMLPSKFGSNEFLAKFMAIVPTEIERLSNITHELLTFSKPSLPHIENIQLSYLFERTVNLVANQLRKYQVEIILELDKVPVLQGDFQQLTQVFLNLILNAMQASKPNSKIHVSYNVEQLPEGEKRNGFSKFLSVTVSDEGSGIKRKDLSKIFQPFFTTKAEGTGLGLANCKRIVEAHRGEILVESEPEKGTRFSVVIPMELTEEALKA